MLPYYIVYGFMFVISLLRFREEHNDLEKEKKTICVCITLIWILMLGLRHPSMGTDLRYGSDYGYLGRFAYIGQLDWGTLLRRSVQNYEKGYIIFNKLISYLGDDPQILLFVCAATSLIPVGIWIYRNSSLPLLSWVIYLGIPCFMINFSGLRQGLAIALTTFSLEMIRERKFFRFLLLVFLATQFHVSAWVFFFAYPIYHFRLNTLFRQLTLVLPVITYVFRRPLFTVLSKLFKENAVPDDNGAVLLFIVFFMVYFFTIAFNHKDDPDEQGLQNIFLIATVCQSFSSLYQNVLRVSYYYMVALVILLPRVISNIGKSYRYSGPRNAILIYTVLFFCFAAFGLYSISSATWEMSNPYLFFWQG